jgi:hypothetical protein
MSFASATPHYRTAADGFERYYAEKIWEWIPEIYRHEDGLADNPDVLRAIVEILAREAAIARRSIDRLWEDEFIDFADDWAIPYIGDLLGTRLVHELNRRGRRVDVAKTIFYRRRKGTPQVMAALIRDITGWDGVVVEAFRRLGRTRHGLDPEPGTLAGLVTGTPPGGLADLRRVRGGDLVDGPFDEYHHTPDFRRLEGLQGRYNISKVNFHLFRLRAFEVQLADAVELGGQVFTFDPSGRDVPLFRPSQRPGDEDWRPVAEWEIEAPIPCRLLGAASYELSPDAIPTGLELELSRWIGERFVHETRLRETFATVLSPMDLTDNLPEILASAITEDSPKLHLIAEAVAVTVGEEPDDPPFDHEDIDAGSLAVLSPPATDKPLVIDPVRGRFAVVEPLGTGQQVFVPRYHYGFSGPIGAGTYDRRAVEERTPDSVLSGGGPIAAASILNQGVTQIDDNRTYGPPVGDKLAVRDLTFQAANRRRPYLRLDSNWVLRADGNAGSRLLLDGLWVGAQSADLALSLRGDYDRVTLTSVTLDPGGAQQLDGGALLPALRLEIGGFVEELVIDCCITGPLEEALDELDPCSVGKLIVRDSIVQSIDPDVDAIATRIGEVHLERVTVLGDVAVNRLYASEALITGTVVVSDNQHGCFRFSAADDDPANRLPQQFESHFFAGGVPNRFFVSRRFGDPGYAQLAEAAPDTIRRGGENGSEIGAFNLLLNPIKLDDLRAKVNEFMPFGLIAQYIHET